MTATSAYLNRESSPLADHVAELQAAYHAVRAARWRMQCQGLPPDQAMDEEWVSLGKKIEQLTGRWP